MGTSKKKKWIWGSPVIVLLISGIFNYFMPIFSFVDELKDDKAQEESVQVQSEILEIEKESNLSMQQYLLPEIGQNEKLFSKMTVNELMLVNFYSFCVNIVSGQALLHEEDKEWSKNLHMYLDNTKKDYESSKKLLLGKEENIEQSYLFHHYNLMKQDNNNIIRSSEEHKLKFGQREL